MRVQVLRVSGMPYNTQIWVDDQPQKFTVYIDEALITEAGVRVLEIVLNYSIQFWGRLPDSEGQRPTLRPVVG